MLEPIQPMSFLDIGKRLNTMNKTALPLIKHRIYWPENFITVKAELKKILRNKKTAKHEDFKLNHARKT